MKTPSQQELMEFADGTLSPVRYREVEQLVAQSHRLQSEVKLLRSLRRTIQQEAEQPSKKFTENVMFELAPVRQETLWMKIAKNSSSLFAMVLVLSMIGIVFVAGPGKTQSESNLFTKTVESYATAYDTALQNIGVWMQKISQPVNHAASTPSGKFLFIGLAIFFVVVIVDEILGKRFFHARIKH